MVVMAKLEDAADCDSAVLKREGSSPFYHPLFRECSVMAARFVRGEEEAFKSHIFDFDG